MPNSFGPDAEHALLQQELSESEVRELLERLSAEEFAAPSLATVSAVCEATGASAELIGRILADIRKQNIEERYGETIERHEEKIGELDERAHKVATETRAIRHRTESLMGSRRWSPKPRAQDSEVSAELELMAQERIAARKAAPYVVGSLIIALMIFAPFMCASPQGGYSDRPTSWSSMDLPNGAKISVNNRGRVWVTEADGSERMPTDAEMEQSIALQIGMAQRASSK